jgi:membrane fusion protein (multidrug efflux system)
MFYLTFALFGCYEKKEKTERDPISSKIKIEKTIVKTHKIKRKDFAAIVITTGKIQAHQEIPVYFKGSGIITGINVLNGDAVRPGQLLATMENSQQQLDLQAARTQLEESRVEINDLLISQGGSSGDSTSVNKDVFKFIKLRSGYSRAQLAIQKAEYELAKSYLFAPTFGIIANLTISTFNKASQEIPFCTLLNRNQIFTRCSILETELRSAKVGQHAMIEPVGTPHLTCEGEIVDINQLVNTLGMVDVNVRILKPAPGLLHGMNVRVIIKNIYKDQLTVPKEAIVERNGRKVVFVFSNGYAKWRYVITGKENHEEIVINDGLENGDEVIISGNINLGHDAQVERDGETLSKIPVKPQ